MRLTEDVAERARQLGRNLGAVRVGELSGSSAPEIKKFDYYRVEDVGVQAMQAEISSQYAQCGQVLSAAVIDMKRKSDNNALMLARRIRNAGCLIYIAEDDDAVHFIPSDEL